MEIFWTADQHFNHHNIIGYCHRPFRNVNEMNHAMIDNWNSVVKKTDIVYHLGDFAMGDKNHWKRFVDSLNGYKILVRGNHDKGRDFMLSIGFDEVHENMVYGDWNLQHHPYYGMDKKVLCGHVHEKWLRLGDCINVGVDQWGFKPQKIEALANAVQSDRNYVCRCGMTLSTLKIHEDHYKCEEINHVERQYPLEHR